MEERQVVELEFPFARGENPKRQVANDRRCSCTGQKKIFSWQKEKVNLRASPSKSKAKTWVCGKGSLPSEGGKKKSPKTGKPEKKLPEEKGAISILLFEGGEAEDIEGLRQLRKKTQKKKKGAGRLHVKGPETSTDMLEKETTNGIRQTLCTGVRKSRSSLFEEGANALSNQKKARGKKSVREQEESRRADLLPFTLKGEGGLLRCHTEKKGGTSGRDRRHRRDRSRLSEGKEGGKTAAAFGSGK